MGKFEEIAYELSKLWKHLTRQELCEYYNITDRTLYNYQKKLNLPKNESEVQDVKNPMTITINTPDNKNKTQTFKSYNHFVIWSKAQSHPFRITDNKSINMDYSRLTDDAKRYMETIK